MKCAPGHRLRRGPPAGSTARDRGDLGRGTGAGGLVGLAEARVPPCASVLDRDRVLTDTDPDDCLRSGRRAAGSSTPTVAGGADRADPGSTRPGTGWQLDPDIAYLSGDRPPAGVRGRRADRVASEKASAVGAAWRDCGALEILVRGVDVDPIALQCRGCGRRAPALPVVT